MSETFDFIVVGGGSAGAVIAARLSEDPACRVALLEAGDRPPEVELMPVACGAMQLNPATDWMYTADPGKAGLGLRGRRVPVPRGKMLGGSSGLNYMAYVRGHPGDFDSWAERGATGWSYADVLPYFRKSEGFAPCDEIVIDEPAHNSAGPMGVSVRSPVLPGAREFVEAAEAAGIPRGDYNGRERGGAAGVVSLVQTSTQQGKRSSTTLVPLIGNVTCTPGSVSDRPKVPPPVFLAQGRVFLLQSARCPTLHPLNQVRQRLRRRILNMHVHMVFAHHSLQYSHVFRVTDLQQQHDYISAFHLTMELLAFICWALDERSYRHLSPPE
jgi:choline dehydrogenase-like flavoprotein